MALGKWIGGFLGIASGGVLGALAGFALGALFDRGLDTVNTSEQGRTGFDGNHDRQDSYRSEFREEEYNSRSQNFNNGFAGSRHRYSEEGQRNSFLFSLLVLSSYIIRADGKVMHSEMELVRSFLRHNFGDIAVQQGQDILYRLFDQQKKIGMGQYRTVIQDSGHQIARNMPYEQRLQLLNFLCMIAQADGEILQVEIDALNDVAIAMEVPVSAVESMLNLHDGGNNLEAAYRVMGVHPEATDAEVKAAYRRLALQNHPDRVAALGEDVRKAAEKKFQDINAAKETIWKARGLS